MKRLRKPVHPEKVLLLDVLVPLGITITDAASMMGITCKALSGFMHRDYLSG
jgi:plasmid maintenance system antidote protein VapI